MTAALVLSAGTILGLVGGFLLGTRRGYRRGWDEGEVAGMRRTEAAYNALIRSAAEKSLDDHERAARMQRVLEQMGGGPGKA